jgi:hypothetical protein
MQGGPKRNETLATFHNKDRKRGTEMERKSIKHTWQASTAVQFQFQCHFVAHTTHTSVMK